MFVLHEELATLKPHHADSSHTEHGLTYLAKGWLRMDHGGPVRIDAGTITLIPAGVPHRDLEGENVEYWLAAFCATCLTLDESQTLMSPFRRVRHGALPVVTVPEARRKRVLQLFRDLESETQREAPEAPELARALLLLLLGEVRRAMPGPAQSGAKDSLVSDTLEVIQQRCLQPLSLKDVAAAVHRTPAHVTATLKAATGYSVGEWIAAGKVSEAAARLAHTDDSLDDIARHVGWQDKTHFIRQFKKAHGVTPAAWRRQQREQHRG